LKTWSNAASSRGRAGSLPGGTAFRLEAGSGEGKEAPRLLVQIPVPLDRPDLKAAVREVEKQMIRIALERTGGSRPKAAELLGISHPALLYKAKAYGLN
jgi:two-component system response regulator AtoC